MSRGDPATTALVHSIRDDRAAVEGQTGAHILVGGTTASNIDVSAKLSSALPIFLTRASWQAWSCSCSTWRLTRGRTSSSMADGPPPPRQPDHGR